MTIFIYLGFKSTNASVNAHSVLTLFKNYFKDKLTNPPWNLKLSSNE